jgi:uncharacterized membrane protein YedE/YeeE
VTPNARSAPRPAETLLFVLLGVGFGIVLVKAEIVSWWRIQEMFRFQAFHMYGILGSAVLAAMVLTRLAKLLGMKTVSGEDFHVPAKELGRGTRYWAGGIVFGLGWAISGACPGPLFAVVGAGTVSFTLAIVGALAGTFVYAHVRPRLPH